MNFAGVREMAGRDRLYPGVILYGASFEQRRQSAVETARILLCEGDRPCPEGEGACRHCRRVAWPEKGAERFHPDFHVLERDLRTSTSVAATRSFFSGAYNAPFEARGQVFVIAEADTLTGGAADSLLKLLEEPPSRSPRHFLLLAASRLDLLPTLRSRSLSIFLGAGEALDGDRVEEIAAAFGRSLDAFCGDPSAIYLLSAAEALARAPGWSDPRARGPWSTTAAAVLRALDGRQLAPPLRRALLAFAEELLDAPRMRVRGIPQGRILEGLLTRHLGPMAARPT